jgi:hypothetical protein
MEDEVIRLIKTSPQWKPGMQNGHVVKAIKKQPVTFMVGGQPVLKEVTIVYNESPRMVDVKEVEKLNAIYPNPTTNSATILYNTHTAGEGEIRVYDVSSKLQKTVKINLIQGLNTVSVDMSNLAKGMYVVVVTDAEKKIGKTYKVVKE